MHGRLQIRTQRWQVLQGVPPWVVVTRCCRHQSQNRQGGSDSGPAQKMPRMPPCGTELASLIQASDAPGSCSCAQRQDWHQEADLFVWQQRVARHVYHGEECSVAQTWLQNGAHQPQWKRPQQRSWESGGEIPMPWRYSPLRAPVANDIEPEHLELRPHQSAPQQAVERHCRGRCDCCRCCSCHNRGPHWELPRPENVYPHQCQQRQDVTPEELEISDEWKGMYRPRNTGTEIIRICGQLPVDSILCPHAFAL